MKILGASIGDCVHIQGVYSFLKLADENGHETEFLGPAVSVDRLVATIQKEKPDCVALSYRLTPENAKPLIDELQQKVAAAGLEGLDYLLGGTPPVAEVATDTGFFKLVSDGSNQDDVLSYVLMKSKGADLKEVPPQDVVERIGWKKPILRTHFGLPNVDETAEGIRMIADSGLIDVISLGTDQDAQANFYHPERQNPASKGAGGVPVRSPDDFRKIYDATRTGNFPLMRTYAGTDDLVKLAEMYDDTFGNAWAAVPIFWFNAMDGRGPQPLEQSISEHLDLIRWNAERGKPVELLEAHHWAMRWAHDSLVAASAYLGAAIAKELGVKDYIHQYMFNVPAQSSFPNELAKMLAVKEMLSSLEDGDFRMYHQTRTGLPSFPNNLEEARAQLATSTMLQMQLKPDIVHVVNYTEPHHAARPEEVINSARIVKQVLQNNKYPVNMSDDSYVEFRKLVILGEADTLISHIMREGDITSPDYLCSIVTSGLFDAPMLKNNPYAKGFLRTAFVDGECHAVDLTGAQVMEEERIKAYGIIKRIGGG